MQLIYRGHIYEYTPRPARPDVQPRAVNWRYQLPGQTFESTPRPARPDVKPRAVNWRYQLPDTIPFS